MKIFYDTPTQVMFHNPDGGYSFGIAWGDKIICACCGGVLEIEEVRESALEDQPAIYEYCTWNDLSEEIFGGEYPEGYNSQDNEG